MCIGVRVVVVLESCTFTLSNLADGSFPSRLVAFGFSVMSSRQSWWMSWLKNCGAHFRPQQHLLYLRWLSSSLYYLRVYSLDS